MASWDSASPQTKPMKNQSSNHVTTLRRRLLYTAVAACLLAAAGNASAHDPSLHRAAPADAKPIPAKLVGQPTGTLPFDRIGGPFALTDHNGQPRSDADFRGRYMLIFFGYANCDSICPVGLQRMAAALDELGDRGDKVQPLMITVDPENDTPAALAKTMPKIHPRLLGLTGSTGAIDAAKRTYQVESTQVSQAGDGSPIYAHGSFIYLMRPDGSFATLIPPVIGVDKMADLMRRYIQ